MISILDNHFAKLNKTSQQNIRDCTKKPQKYILQKTQKGYLFRKETLRQGHLPKGKEK